MSGRYWCVSDCCGIVCVVITWLLVAYAEFVVTMVILGPQVRIKVTLSSTVGFYYLEMQ